MRYYTYTVTSGWTMIMQLCENGMLSMWNCNTGEWIQIPDETLMYIEDPVEISAEELEGIVFLGTI